MEFIIIFILITMITMSPGIPDLSAGQLTARQIMEQVENQRTVNKSRSHEMTMTLIDPNGYSQKRVFRIFSKESNGVKKKIIFVKQPPKLKHTGFLTIDYQDKNKENDQWIYLPSIGKHKRIATSDRDNSFMGSDLNYSDLNSRRVDDYNYRILKETVVKEKDAWLIESLPKSKSIIEQTGYKKTILAIQKKNYSILRIITWSDDNKTIKINDFNDFIFLKNVWIPRDIVVVSRVGNITLHTTRLHIDKIQLDLDLPDDYFTVRSLKKGFVNDN